MAPYSRRLMGCARQFDVDGAVPPLLLFSASLTVNGRSELGHVNAYDNDCDARCLMCGRAQFRAVSLLISAVGCD